MMTTKLRGTILTLWVLALVHIALIMGPDDVAMAWKTESSSASYNPKTGPLGSQVLPRLLSIKGGDIVHLRSMEETEEVVAENATHDDQLVVIYFSSKNCPPCKRVAPLFIELSEEFGESGKVIFCKVNVDENPDTASMYQVTGWPTFLFLKKGEKVMEIVGGNLAEATLFDWVKLMAPKEKEEKEEVSNEGN